MKKLSSTKLAPGAKKVGDHWSRPCGMLQLVLKRNGQNELPDTREQRGTSNTPSYFYSGYILSLRQPQTTFFLKTPPWALGLCEAHSQHLSLLCCSWLVKSHLLHTILFRVIHFLTQMGHLHVSLLYFILFHLVRFGLLYHSDKHLLSWFHNPTFFLSL